MKDKVLARRQLLVLWERGREGQKSGPPSGVVPAVRQPGQVTGNRTGLSFPRSSFYKRVALCSAISPKDWTMPWTVFLSQYPKDRGIWYPFQDTIEEVTFFPFASGVHSPRVLWFTFQLSSHYPWILKTAYLTARLRWFGNADLTFKWCRYIFIENLFIR